MIQWLRTAPEGPGRARQLPALMLVVEERARQEAKLARGEFTWTAASPEASDSLKLAVLGEEFGEVCRAIGEHEPRARLREELVQVAAVAVAWIEALDG